MYGIKQFEDFRVGDKAVFSKTITQADVVTYAGLSGDHHPAHLDVGYARSTRFGRRVVHGMLVASLISTANGLLLQRPGAISLEQMLRFIRPVFVGDTITACSEVTAIFSAQRRLRCRTTCTNQHGQLVIAGEAIEQKDP